MKVVVKGKNINVVESVTVANTMWARGMGLMFKKSLREDEGMLIDPCNSIHTFFMNFKIDVLFINKSNEIVKIKRSMPPWRMSTIYFSSKKVLELMGGVLPESVEEGDTLEFINV